MKKHPPGLFSKYAVREREAPPWALQIHYLKTIFRKEYEEAPSCALFYIHYSRKREAPSWAFPNTLSEDWYLEKNKKKHPPGLF